MPAHRSSRLPRLALAAAALLLAAPAPAVITIHAGPFIEFSNGTPGYSAAGGPTFIINDDDAIIPALKVDATGQYLGIRTLRWDSSGNVMEYLSPYTNPERAGSDDVRAVNASGVAVGSSSSPPGVAYGQSAVRWDPSGVPTLLGDLGVIPDGSSYSQALGLNSAGVAVGYGQKYSVQDIYLGTRALRWDPDSTTPVELGHLGTNSIGHTITQAYDINDAGVIVGYADKFSPYNSDSLMGQRPVRWDPGSTTPVELPLPLKSVYSDARVQGMLINNSGVIAGVIGYSINLNFIRHAIRWDPSGTAAELTLPASYVASPMGFLAGINDTGVIIGSSTITAPNGVALGTRALRWDPPSTVATVLPTLGLRADGYGDTIVSAINNAGLIVGRSRDYSAPNPSIEYATLWTPANRIIDLNTVIAPDSGWRLTHARDISDTGWILGSGYYDPDGPGSLSSFLSYFFLHVTYFDPGDFNLDGSVNTQDIDPFVTALADVNAYRAYALDRMSTLAIDPGELDLILQFLDPSGDNLINVQDINPFIAALSAAGPLDLQSLALIPEPATLALLLLTAPLFTRRRCL